MKMFKLASKITGILTAAAMLCSSTLVASAAESSSTMLFRSLGYTEAEIATINEASVPNPCYFVYLQANSGANVNGSVTTSMTFDSSRFTYEGTLTTSYVTGTPTVSVTSINPNGWYSNTTSCNIETGMSAVLLYRTKLTAVAAQREHIGAVYGGRVEGERITAYYTRPTVTMAYSNGEPLYSPGSFFTGGNIVAVGDVDFDGVISSEDTDMITDYIAGTNAESWSYREFLAADVNFDNVINISDLVKTSRVMSGDLSTFW